MEDDSGNASDMKLQSSVFEYDCEAIRVVATRKASTKKGRTTAAEMETRKFSVDPNLTSFDTLRTILGRAFDIGSSSDFAVDYLSPATGERLPMLNDWDLDAAIVTVSASIAEESTSGGILNLVVTERKFKKLALDEDEAGLPKIQELQPSLGDQEPVSISNRGGGGTSPGGTPKAAFVSSMKEHLEHIVPSITNKLQRAINLAEDTFAARNIQLQQQQFLTEPGYMQAEPVTEIDMRKHFNKVGEIVAPRELRLAIYRRGISSEGGIRKVLWKYLLDVYPPGLSGKARMEHIKCKEKEYERLRSGWTEQVARGRITDDVKYVTNMVKKDVFRTDRHLPFYAGEGNVHSLYNILTTYALNHPSTGYCQGMSDLLSPILFVMREEAPAYVCFCALMTRLRPNFLPDGVAVTKKFEHLSQAILYHDPEFFAYLKLRHADDLLYCYRWLLLEMKREFNFNDACVALEVLWASLPPQERPPEGVPLCEKKPFKVSPKQQHRPKPGGGTSHGCHQSSFLRREPPFSKVVTERKRVSSTGDSSLLGRSLRGASRVNPRDRIQSDGAADDKKKKNSDMKKSCSLSNHAADRQQNESSGKKKVKDLNDFYRMANKKTEETPDVKESVEDVEDDDEGFLLVGNCLSARLDRLPPPTVFGDGNPFLMFMCLACLLQHRDHIMNQQLDYQEIAMHFDRMVRRHDVRSTLAEAKKMFAEYLNDEWKREEKVSNNGQVNNRSNAAISGVESV